jgi:hypothetical protein
LEVKAAHVHRKVVMANQEYQMIRGLITRKKGGRKC